MDIPEFKNILEESGLTEAQMQEVLYYFDQLKLDTVEGANKNLEKAGSDMRVASLESSSVQDWRSRAADIARKISDYYGD